MMYDTDTREFGSRTFEWRAKANGWKWARVAVWDVAANVGGQHPGLDPFDNAAPSGAAAFAGVLLSYSAYSGSYRPCSFTA